MNEVERRLYQLPPGFRFRIDSYKQYHPHWSVEHELCLSEVAYGFAETIQDEAMVYFWTLKDSDDKRSTRDMGTLSDDELDHVGRLALEYLRGSVDKVHMFGDSVDKVETLRDSVDDN